MNMNTPVGLRYRSRPGRPEGRTVQASVAAWGPAGLGVHSDVVSRSRAGTSAAPVSGMHSQRHDRAPSANRSRLTTWAGHRTKSPGQLAMLRAAPAQVAAAIRYSSPAGRTPTSLTSSRPTPSDTLLGSGVAAPYLRRVFTTVALKDRRTLEYADLGDPSGTPVMFFHGTPATAGQAAIIADAAGRHGVRLIAASRPGYGASTNSPPGLAPTAAAMLEMADQVGLQRFAVLGASGGGPFALAAAAVAPARVGAVVVTGGLGVCSEVTPEVLGDEDRWALALLAEGDVEVAVRIMTELCDPRLAGLRGLSGEEFSAALQKRAPPGEKDWFDEHPDLRAPFEGDFQRAITTSDGYTRDNLSWLGPWDIDLSAVTAPVWLVYGESDKVAAPAHGEWLHARLPSSELHVVPGGHGDVTFGAADSALAAITRL